ncbi:MAG TPA: hypothetical protein VGL86_16885, partial [Polyangia bacterium]
EGRAVKRRAFIAALATAPLFIRRAFGDASVGSARVGARVTMPTARPTLVLVVPRDDAKRWERGKLFGDLLTHADDTLLARLSLVDVICGRASDFGTPGEPLVLFVVGSTVHRLDKPPAERFIGEMIALPAAPSVPVLAATARARYVKHAPHGSRWGTTGTCGAHYDEGPQEMVDCGMAFAPEASRRFLDFYVKAS